MRTRAITPRDECSMPVFDRFQGGDYVFRSLHARGIGLWSHENEIVVHYRIPLHSLAFGEEFFLRGLCMHEHHVCITTPSCVERLARALRYHPYVDTGLGLEQRQDMAEEA